MKIVHFALSVEELRLLNRKTSYRTSVIVPQQPYVRTAAARFPLVNSQLFVLVLLYVASPTELQQTLILCYKTLIDYIASALQGFSNL